ncbi:MAG: hypothetical protein ACUVV3_03680 [Dehalococcoidia bacterium]
MIVLLPTTFDIERCEPLVEEKAGLNPARFRAAKISSLEQSGSLLTLLLEPSQCEDESLLPHAREELGNHPSLVALAKEGSHAL